jgi:flagellar biosynthesis/type III secretory pathway protein FliH
MRIEIIKGPVLPLRRIDRIQGARLVSAVQAAANRDAEALIDTARREAERIVAEARSEAGRVAGEIRAAAANDGARKWNEAALALARTREESMAGLEREPLALAVEIARRIVGDLVANSSEAWADLVERSTSRLRRDATLVIRHATIDTSRVDSVRDRLTAFREVAFEADDALGIGDCIAECAGVRVDARLDMQVAAIERLLLESPRTEART